MPIFQYQSSSFRQYLDYIVNKLHSSRTLQQIINTLARKMSIYDPLVQACDPVIFNLRREQDSVVAMQRMKPTSYDTQSIEKEVVAKQKLNAWGFDPNDVSKSSTVWFDSNCCYDRRESRPMIIFAHLGDLPMIRYILQKSDDPICEMSKTDEHGLFPMYVAISETHDENHILTICQFLHQNGANIQQTLAGEWTCLSRACLKGMDKVAFWLVKEGGALLNSETGEFDHEVARRDLPATGYEDICGHAASNRAHRVHSQIFQWSKEIVATRNHFRLFLIGTMNLSSRRDVIANPKICVKRIMVSRGLFSAESIQFLLEDMTDEKLREFLDKASSPLTMFNGQHGILQQISEYLGVETNTKILKTALGLVEHEETWNLRELYYVD